jgi:hypothetical protein
MMMKHVNKNWKSKFPREETADPVGGRRPSNKCRWDVFQKTHARLFVLRESVTSTLFDAQFTALFSIGYIIMSDDVVTGEIATHVIFDTTFSDMPNVRRQSRSPRTEIQTRNGI